MNIKKTIKIDPRTVPCGTPVITGILLEQEFSAIINYFDDSEKRFDPLQSESLIIYEYHTSLVYTSCWCRRVSKALTKSNKIRSDCMYHGHKYLSSCIKDLRVEYHRNGCDEIHVEQ